MTYTEIKTRNSTKYYYRVKSSREKGKSIKKRIYLGKNLIKKELISKEVEADKILDIKKRNNMLNKIIPKIKKILKKNKIKKAGIFGSYARGEQKENSDVDILIQPTKGMSLLDISGLKIELKTALGKKVDIVSYNYIHPFLKKKILESEVKII